MKIFSRPYKTSGLLVKKHNKFFFEDLFSKKVFKNITFNAKNFFDIQLISCEIQFSNKKYVLNNFQDILQLLQKKLHTEKEIHVQLILYFQTSTYMF